MFFANDTRDKVREENPGITFGKPSFYSIALTPILTPHVGQVGKMLGDKWKALSETERKPYDAKAAADKKRYEEDKVKYQAVSFPIDDSRLSFNANFFTAARRGG